MAWDRLPEGQGEALPMCGGFFTLYFEHKILSVAVNTRVLCDIMVKGTNEVKSDSFNEPLDFSTNGHRASKFRAVKFCNILSHLIIPGVNPKKLKIL